MAMVLWVMGTLIATWLLYMTLIEPNRLVKRFEHITGKNKKAIRIVHFSDTHFHRYFSKRKLKRLINEINTLQPDLLIFSGDLMEHYALAPNLAYQLPPYLRQMQARLGKIAVYGNHDIGGDAKYVYPQMMEAAGFQLLCNQTMVYEEEGIAIFGMDDAIAGYEDRDLTKQRLQPFQMLVVHEPDMMDELDTSAIALMLSGHTHGGQIYLPLLSKRILPKGGKRYRKGWYHKADTDLFVSCGIGMRALPMRFLNPPEIVIYDIDASDS